MMRFLSFSVLIFTLLASVSNTANAYTETSTGMPMVIELSPAEPGPNQEVRATLKSYSFNLNQSTISWRVNGGQATTDTHATAITFTTGSVGSATILNITATIGKNKAQKTITIRPASANLLWQADSVVPKNYQGKPLASTGSEITVIALPNFIGTNGIAIKPENLVYNWEKDHQRIGNASGLGKNTFKIIMGSGGGAVNVKINTPDKQITAVNAINISPAKPKVVFYEDHPLNGPMINRALIGSLNLTTDEITLAAEPFYFSPTNLKFNWTLNKKPFNAGASLANKALLGKPSFGSGQSQVSVEVVNQDKTSQSANALINILFGNTKMTL